MQNLDLGQRTKIALPCAKVMAAMCVWFFIFFSLLCIRDVKSLALDLRDLLRAGKAVELMRLVIIALRIFRQDNVMHFKSADNSKKFQTNKLKGRRTPSAATGIELCGALIFDARFISPATAITRRCTCTWWI